MLACSMPDLVAQVTSSLLQFPDVSVQALGEDEIRLDLVLRGKFAQGQNGWAWLACGPQLEVVNSVTGERLSAYRFSGIEQPPTVLAVKEFCWLKRTGLLVGLEETEGSVLCLYDLGLSRVVKAVVLPGRVTAIEPIINHGGANASTQHLHQSLRWFFGVAAVVTDLGHVFLIDICLDDLSCSQSELEASDLEIINRFPADVPQIRETVTRDGRHLCYQLHSATGTSATTLHYISRTNQLAVGFADGYLSLWNLKTLKKEYHCQLEGGRVPIYAVIFQEPENDPRSCCYLWAVQSAQDFEADVLSLHLLQLAFGDRKCISSGQILYEGLEYCEERYSQDLSRGIVSFRGQASNIKLLGCQTIEKFRGHSDREESMNEAMSPDTSIAVFSWQVNPYGQGKPSSYLGVFDINRWYHAQMPDSLRPGEFLHNCPYFSLWSLDSVVGMISPYYLLDILVHEKSLSRGVPPSYPPPEQFFSPSSYNFDATCLLNFGIVHLTCSGFQKETLQFLKKSGTCLDDAIPNGYNRCLVAGLLSPRLTDIQPSCLTEEEQLEALMTAAVETSSLGLLSGCIRQWSAEGAAAHLRFVLEWAWKKVVGTKEELDRICTPLFDGSCNFIDIQTFQSLQRCQLLLCNLSTIFSCFLTEAHDVTEKGLVELTNKCVVTTLLSQYAQVVLWFCRSGLLPDGSDEDEVLQLSRPFYNYQLIQSYYTSRRQKLERLSRGKWCGDCLMVDGMISQFGERIEKLWRRDDGGTGRYPPSTLHALLDIYLQENVQEMQKHAVIIYLLLDVMYSFPNKNKSSIEAFPTAFAIPLGLVKLIQGFWLLDHGDHENSLDLILHPATSRLLSSMEHKRIIHALMCQGEHKQALRYVQTMKPLMNTISEVKLYLSVLLLNRCMVEARDLVRQHASRLNMEDLLKHMYETCQEMSLMEDLLKLPFTAAEQDCLERFLYNSGGMQSHEFLLVHHLQRANYVPALQLNQSLNMNLMNDRVPRMRERATARNSILDQYGRVLPRVQRRLATERVKPYYHPSTVLREVSRPVPLSTVAKPVVSGKILTKATFINNLLSKIGEVWPRSQRNVNLSPYNSSDIEDESPSASPVELPDAFVGTPVTTSFKRMSSRLFESVVCPVPLSPPIDSIQQMQSKTSPVWMTFSPARRSSAVSSQLKRISKASELSLLKTPPVVKKAKALASTTSGFSGFAPQSILRSSLRPSPLASPSASPGRSVTPPLRIKETRISFMEENIASTWNRNTADKESNLLPRSLSTSPWAARLEKVISFDLHKRFETEVPERTSSNEKYIAAEADISKEISSTSVRSEQSTLEYHDAQAPDDFYEESATLNSRPVENVNAEPIKNGEHEIFRSTALECFELVASTGKHSEPKSVARPAGLNGLSETAEEEPTDSMNEENVQCIDRLDRINSADTELVNGPAETAKNTFAEVPEHEIIEQITQPVPDQVFDHRHLETVNNESTTIGGSEHSAGAAETVCSSIEHREEPAIEMSHNQQLDSSNRETSVEHEELNETESCAFPENGISSFAFSHPMHEAFTSQYTTREIENLTSNYETEGALLVSDECNTLIKITESASAVSENESVTVHDNEGVFASTYIENSLESGSAFLKTYDIEAKVVEENECQQDEHFIILPVKALEIHMVEDGELEEQTTEDSGEVSYVECHPPQPFQVSCTLDAEFMSNKINDNDMSTTEAAKCVSMNGNHDGPEENFTLILEGEDECSDTETTSTFHITTTVEVVDQEYEDQTSLQKSPTLVLVQEPNNADAPTYVPESVKEAVAESLSDAVKDTRNKDFVEMVETLDEEKTETDKALGRYLCQSLQPVVQDVKDPEVNDQVEVKETSNESDRGRSVLTKDETSFEILQSESEQNEQEVATLYPGSVEKLKEQFEIPETMHPDLTEGQIAGVSPAERLLPSPRRSTRKVQERLRSLEGVHPVSGEGSIAPVCPVVRSSPSPRRSTRKIQQRYGNNEMHPESGEEQIAQASPAVKFSQSPRNSTRRVQQRFESPEIVHPESGKEQIAGVSPALRSSTPSSSNQKAEQRFESPEVENLESEEEHITGVPLALRFSLSPTMSTKKAEQRFESPETEHPYSGEGQVDGVSTTLSSQSPKRSAKKEQTFESHEEELPVSGEDQIDGVSVALRSSQSPGRSTEKAEQRFESPETEHADAGEGQTAGVFPVLRALQSPRMSTEKEPRFGSPEAVFPLPGGQTAKVSPTLRSSTSPRKSTRKVQQRFESPKAMHPDSAEEKIAEVSPALRSSPSPRRSTKKVEERFGSQKAVHSNLGDEQSSEESPNLTASPSLERSAGKLGARLPSPEAIQPESNERLIAQLFPTLRASASPRRSARRVRETFDTPEAVRPESPEGQSAQVSALRRSTRKKNTNVEMSGKAHPLADKRAQTPASVGRVTRSKKDAPLAIPEIWQTEVEDKHFKKTDQSLVSSSGVLKVTKGSSDVLQADLLSPKMTEISASPVRSSRKAKGITFSLPENVIDTQEKKTEQTSPKSFTKRAGRSRVLQSKEVTVPVSAETFDQLEHALLPFTPVSARKGTSYLQENIKNIGNVQDTIPLQEKLPVSLRRSARKATTSELKHTEASSALGKISVEPSTESILSKSAGKTAQTTKYHSVKEQLPAVEDISDEVFLQSESIDKNRLGGTNTNAPVIASRIEESISVKTTRATRSRAARDLSPEAAVKESEAPVFTRIARNSRVIEEPEHPVSSDVPQSLVSSKSVSSTPAIRSKKKTKSVEEMGLPVIEDEVPKVTDIDETQTRAKSKAVKAAVKKRKRLKGGLWSPPPVEVNLISPLPSPLEEYMSNRKGADDATTKMILRTNRKRLMSAFPKPVTRRKML